MVTTWGVECLDLRLLTAFASALAGSVIKVLWLAVVEMV